MKTTEQELTGAPVADVRAPSAATTTREPKAPALSEDLGQDISAGQLILSAIDKGASIETIERLVALKERIEDRNAIKEFTQALARVKAKLPTILHSKKAAFNTSTGGKVNYSYTELDELAAVVDPFLTAEGFTYHWEQKLDKNMNTTTCVLQHVGGHSRSASFTLPTDNNSAASPQQKIGMADTYAARRSLIAVLGLTTADNDPRPAEIDPTPINEDQALVIEDLLKARIAGKTPENAEAFRTKFLAHMEVDSIAKIPAAQYKKAVAALQPAQPKGAK